jgi:glycosyltransferase involved in cell wall biosynthesis
LAADRALRLAFLGNPNAVHLRRWLRFFAARGHEVVLLDGFGFEIAPGLDERIRVERYDARGSVRLPLLQSLHSRRTLRRLLAQLDPDVVHAHYLRRYGHQAGIAGHHPYVISTWGSDVLLASPRRRGRWWDWLSLRRADLVTAVSPYMRDAAIRAGARPERVEIVQFGVDMARFAPAPVPRDTLARLGIGERPYILSPRAIRPLYRHETVIDAVATLPTEVGLVMTGLGADPDYLGQLRARIAANGLAERVSVLDVVPDEDLPALYRAARVVVSVPASDSFPISLLEAMACGTPIVAGDLPAVTSMLRDVTPDSIVPTGDPSALAAALRRALDLPDDERRRLGAALRESIGFADYEANMRRMEDLYRGLAGRGS